MRRRTRRLLLLAGLGVGGVLLWNGLAYYRFVHLAVGYGAKVAGSGVFVSGRPLDDVLAEELERFGFVSIEIDRERGLVTGSAFGFAHRYARYRPGLGVTLVDDPDAQLEPAALQLPPPEPADPGLEWPRGTRVSEDPPDGVRGAALRSAVEAAFAEPEPDRPRRTRAVLVVYRDRIIAERYAEGFGPDMPLAGWSMTKSVLNALLGILVRDGRLDVAKPAPVPAWRGLADGRETITIDQLLHMQSGLRFREVYDSPDSDALRMLFDSTDMAAYAAAQPLVAKPGERWSYASGTSLILAGILRRVVGDDDALTFAHRELFRPIGMNSAVLETDAAGTIVASSFCYASTRDWARFGLLYLRGGVWDGTRILPDGWLEYTRTPAERSRRGRWGAHFVLNHGDDAGPVIPGLPRDLFYASGYEGQYVVIVPSAHCVLVRLGQSADDGAFPFAEFVRAVLDALPE